jgi:hypothetical protein
MITGTANNTQIRHILIPSIDSAHRYKPLARAYRQASIARSKNTTHCFFSPKLTDLFQYVSDLKRY